MPKCFLHHDRDAADILKVLCAPGGRLWLCLECKCDPDIVKKTFAKYSSKYAKAIDVFRQPVNANN